MPTTEIPRVSYSAKNQYDGCPRQYRYDRVEKVKPDFPSYISSVVGKAIHETVSLFYKSEQFTLDFLLETWPQQFKKQVERSHYIFKNAGKEEKCIEIGIEILTKFYNTAKELGLLVRPIKTEWRGEVVVTSKSGRQYKVVFVLDLVIVLPSGVIVILDFKSGSYRLTQQEVDINEQLTIYSMGLRKVLGITEEKVGLWYIRYGEVLYSTRTESDYEKVIEAIDQDWQKIRAGEFNPSYQGCFLCPFSRRCEAEDNSAKMKIDQSWIYREPR